jgi:deoxyadenosine/deoxycytidine kinase
MPDSDTLTFNHIAIEGVFKSGKTKLTEILARKLAGRAVYDRSDNPYLKEFYEEKDGSAFLTQLVFLVNRYHQQVGLLQRNLFHERIVCDYLFEKDKIYAYQTLADEELIVYEKIHSIFSEKIVRPDLTIYLQISMPTLLHRIEQDGSSLDKSIAEKYLEDVVEAFDYFFFNYKTTPLLVVKADELNFNQDEDIMDLIDKIQNMKKSTLFYVPLSRSGRGLKKT